jgi:hypothetical protein
MRVVDWLWASYERKEAANKVIDSLLSMLGWQRVWR